MTDGSPRAKRITSQIRADNAEHNIGERTIIAHFDFNTQRQYTPQGQIIRVWAYSDGLVYFDDISRQIDGCFQLKEPFHWPKDYDFIQKVVMSYYDRNAYTGGTVAMYDQFEKSKRCGHFSIKRDSVTYPNFLCLDCGSTLHWEEVYRLAVENSLVREVK